MVAARLTVRLGIALVCVAGVVVSLIARDSRTTEQAAFGYYVQTHDARGTLKRLDDAKPLNPDFSIDIGEARLDRPNAVRILQKAVKDEPENAELWVRLAQQQVVAHDSAGAQRSYARARELAPLLPPKGPPPGV
jgi:predicted Zn-dependent protease